MYHQECFRQNLGLKIEPMGNSNEPWEIVRFSNSDYAGDPLSRRSISGFILYVLGEPVSWQSKSQKSVSLSSSETEYVALSKPVKEVMFMIQLLKSMKIAVKYQVTVRVENVVAIFMASNVNVIPSMWISGISMLISMLRTELLR